jgi:hypothetical protein
MKNNMKKNIFGIFILIILISSLSYNVFSLGVSPAKKTIVSSESFSDMLFLIKSEDKNFELDVSVNGFLSDYFKIEKNLYLKESRKKIDFSVDIPESIVPGTYEHTISFRPVSSDNSQISAILVPSFPLKIIIPYPGKYVEPSFSSFQNESGVYVSVLLRSLGDKVIDDAYVSFTLSNEKESQEFTTPKTFLSKGDEISFYLPVNIQKDNYVLEANVFYDGEVREIIRDFKLGKPFLKLFSEDNTLSFGKINSFEFVIVSDWNSEIEATATTFIYSDEIITSQVPLTIKPGENDYDAVFDVRELTNGIYNSSIEIESDFVNQTYNFEVVVTDKKQEDNIFNILILAVVIIALLALLIIVFRKAFFKRKL